MTIPGFEHKSIVGCAMLGAGVTLLLCRHSQQAKNARVVEEPMNVHDRTAYEKIRWQSETANCFVSGDVLVRLSHATLRTSTTAARRTAAIVIIRLVKHQPLRRRRTYVRFSHSQCWYRLPSE